MYRRPKIKEMIEDQREVVENLKNIIFGSDPDSQKKYIRDFTEEFTTFRKISSLDDLFISCYKSDLIYIGDYHALKESQLFAAKLIRRIAQRTKTAILTLEMVYTRNQATLDSWMEGKISEEEFLQRIRYEEEWGYDWEGFKAIFDAARDCNVKVFGVDSGPRGGLKHIRRRDRFAAEKIVQLIHLYPEAKIIVLYGESHLAKNHLPRKVKEKLKKNSVEKSEVVIVQNVDRLYWQFKKRGLEYVDVVEVDDRKYCVFNTSLIAKYESYRTTLEKWKGLGDDDEIDLTPTIHNMIDSILKFLEIDKYSYCLHKENGYREYLIDVYPEVYATNDKDFFKGLLKEKNFSQRDIKRIGMHIAEKGSCYVTEINAIFIGTFDVIHGAEESAHFINKVLKGEVGRKRIIQKTLLPYDAFYTTTIEEAIAFFGSKLIDPSRNHFFETDFYQLYGKDKEKIEKKTEYLFEEFNEIINFILLHKKFEKEYEHHDDVPKELLTGIKSEGRLFSILTHEIGYFLGHQIFDAYQKGLIDKEQIVSLFKMRFLKSGSALESYLSFVEKVADLNPF
jgi:uncharacterized iron-regulated protein